MIGIYLGFLLVSPILLFTPCPDWVRNISGLDIDPSRVLRGYKIRFFLFVFIFIAPAVAIGTGLDASKIPHILWAIAIGGFIGLIGDAFLNFLGNYGALARIPYIGGSMNAYLLAKAKKEVEDAKERVRRYEQFDISAAGAA